MIPHEKEVVGRWKDRPFALLGINSDQGGQDALKKIVAEQGITWRNAVLGSTTAPLPAEWNIHGWPTLFLLDAEGVIRWRGHSGDWERTAEELLKTTKAGGPKTGN